MDPQAAFADAVARARQIAAKLGQESGDGINPSKRPIDDPNDFVPGGNPGLDQQRNSEAAQAAAQASARINQQLGVPQNEPPMQSPPDNQMGGGMGDMVVTEESRVPDM